MFFVALSFLQGPSWPQERAAEALLALGRMDGLQLTPGNPGRWSKAPWFRFNRHMGHDWERMVAKVYGPGDEPLWAHGAIHARPNWRALAARGEGLVFETMYPGAQEPAGLIDAADYLFALQERVPVALDLSHADIAIQAGVLTLDVVRALLEKGDVREVHASWNNKKRDSHLPIPEDYSWMADLEGWSKANPDRPVVLEGYFHKLTHSERVRQVALFERCCSPLAA